MTAHPDFTRDDEEPRRVRATLIAVLLGLVTAFCYRAIDGLDQARELTERRDHQATIREWREGMLRAAVFRLIEGEDSCGDLDYPTAGPDAAPLVD
jgi:hypothetical protein